MLSYPDSASALSPDPVLFSCLFDNLPAIRSVIRSTAWLFWKRACKSYEEEDILSDLKCLVLTQALSFDSTRDPLNYLKGVVRNKVRQEMRKVRLLLESELSNGQDGEDEMAWSLDNQKMAVYQQRPARSVEKEVLDRMDVEIALAGCNPDERKILELVVIQGLSHSEVAKYLGITPAASRKRLERALKSVRLRLEIKAA